MHTEAQAVIIARATAATLRAQVDATAEAELAAHVYVSSYTGERITKPENAWTMDPADHAGFCRITQDPTVEPDYCPALIAESVVLDAERILVEAARILPGCAHVSNNRLLCSGLKNRAEYLDLLLAMYGNSGLS